MIVTKVDDLKGTDREIKGKSGNWVSRRLLLHRDGMNFSFHETVIFAGTETRIWYKHHLEAVYCVGGEGSIEDLDTGETHTIKDGVMYALDEHERHILRAESDLRLICVFHPALVGDEDHDSDGAYPPPSFAQEKEAHA